MRSRVNNGADEVRPGLWSVTVPWPGSPLRYTLVYLLESADGPVLVDAGWPSDSGWDALDAGIRAAGHSTDEIRHVLVTHAHPDHLGLAARVRSASGARVVMHPADAAMLRREPGSGLLGWLRSRGAPPDEAASIMELVRAAVSGYAGMAAPDSLAEDGDKLAGGLRAVWTPGHTPGHLCFYDGDRDVLLTGDHVLPGISPQIALNTGDGPDPLGDYLSSLSRVEEYSTAEALPAHQYRFDGIAARAAALRSHHLARLSEISRAVDVAPGLPTWEVAASVSWSRGWERTTDLARYTAVSETLAHLEYLRRRSMITNRGQGTDAWYTAH